MSQVQLMQFMDACRAFELQRAPELKFWYTLTQSSDAAFIKIAGQTGTGWLSWFDNGFVNVEAYTILEEVIFFRQYQIDDGWDFLLPSLEELQQLLTPATRQ